MTFNVNYDQKTGQIISYQQGGDASDNQCPDDCGTLSFDSLFEAMFDGNGNVVMRVDLKAKQLVFLNPVVIPQPIG